MDHNRPTYVRDGEIATLGETLRFDMNRPGVAGGTQACGKTGCQYFSSTSNASSIPRIYTTLAYESPSFESYMFYDGHDGHDFAFGGDVAWQVQMVK